MMATRHLITGATGATGGEVVRLLLDAGTSVRALAHREDERSRELQRRGAEVVYGDFLDFDAVRSALAGVNCAYFCYPISPGIAQATAQFAQAAKEAGVAFIVNMSQKSARGDAKSAAARQHWLSERVFDWSGVPVAHLRPTYFAEWLLYLAPMIRQGLMLAPFSTTGRHAPIAAEDQARVIVGMFAKPDAHAGKTYPLFGPVELTHPQIAQIVGRVLRKKVKYQQVTMEKFMEVLSAQPPLEQNSAAAMYRDPASQGGRPNYVAQHLHEVAIDHANGVFAGTNNYVLEIGGKAPLTVEAFVDKHRAAFL
jgi:NAD(P)H dehydrogenase (quinone)